MSSKANEKIKSRRPADYLKNIYEEDPEPLKRHFVPTEKELWDVDNYVFLEKRRELISSNG